MTPERSVESAAPEAALRESILAAVREFQRVKFAPRPFVPGTTPIPPSGKVFDGEEMANLVDSGLDFWLTTGRFAQTFERAFAKRLGLPHALLVNSGSSANLLAISTLTAPELGDRRLKPGDEVISTAVSFPTTINPILQCGAVPVLVDAAAPTYDALPELVAAAVTPKTRAIVLAHTLGNPFDLKAMRALADKHGLWLVEDCCDALGSRHDGKLVSSVGDLATFSFYPAHHITMGEGGAVATRGGRLKKLLESYRDWGRDCWCAPGKDDTCGKRFQWQLGGLPAGYDHKYTYSHLGYNLKATDMQAAVGVAQLEKLDGFIAARRRNFDALKRGLKPFEDRLILPEPTPNSEPSWFGFPISVRPGAGFKREELTAFLEAGRIGTRLLFAGNITRQPYFKDQPHRVVGELSGSDAVMRDAFWIGVYPGITPEMIGYVIERFGAFFSKRP
ncbi:MAG TPA: lipopolysaccharide biosynthesis protein RfbH [Elusimicrobiota bacterium]|nr:lipopolysaccharide biosynthesis protein RfbH [Elusimicrobiota bacterium]